MNCDRYGDQWSFRISVFSYILPSSSPYHEDNSDHLVSPWDYDPPRTGWTDRQNRGGEWRGVARLRVTGEHVGMFGHEAGEKHGSNRDASDGEEERDTDERGDRAGW